jgi:hypothetical protein
MCCRGKKERLTCEGQPLGLRSLKLVWLFELFVQVVRHAVTFTTVRETFMHRLGMRQAMALLTLRNRHVLFRMTGRTGDLAVLGLARDQRGQSRVVTCSAKLRCRVIRVGDGQRHMGLVTGRAVALGHRLGMPFVAHHALGNVAVGIGMAEITGKRFMHARVRNHLLLRTSMTTHTNGLLFAIDGDIQGFMRVMAAEAVIDFVVRAAIMALAALQSISVLCDAPFASICAGCSL